MTAAELSPIAFADVDEFSEWENGLGWDVASVQLSGGGVTFDHFAFPGLAVAHFTLEAAMHNVFALPPDHVVFLICRVKLPGFFSGREIPPNVLVVARAGREHVAMLPAGWDTYEFVMTEELVRETEVFPPEFFAQTDRLEDAWLPLPEPQTARFLKSLDGLFAEARRPQDPREGAIQAAAAFDNILDGLSSVIDAGHAVRQGTAPRHTRRADLLPDAEHLMAAHIADDITSQQIAKELGVSYRVLNYAVRDAYGLSPGRFFRAMKLHAARRLLLSTEVPVAQAGALVGMYTPGRFAAQYRRLFGELPSETRASRNGTPRLEPLIVSSS